MIFDKNKLGEILREYFLKGKKETFSMYAEELKRKEVLEIVEKISISIEENSNEINDFLNSFTNKKELKEDLVQLRNTLNNYLISGWNHSLLEYEDFKNKLTLYFKLAFLFSFSDEFKEEKWATLQTKSLLENFFFMHLSCEIENDDIVNMGNLYLKSLSWNPVELEKDRAFFVLQDTFLAAWDHEYRFIDHEFSRRFSRLSYFFEKGLYLWQETPEHQKILSELYTRMGDLKLLGTQYHLNPRGFSEAVSYYEKACFMDSQNTYALEKKRYTEELVYTFLTNARMQHDMRSRVGVIHILLQKIKEESQGVSKENVLHLENHLQRMFAIFEINEKNSSEKVVKQPLLPHLEKVKNLGYSLNFNINCSSNISIYFIPKFLDVIMENLIKNTITAYENIQKPLSERIFDIVFDERRGRIIFHDRAGGIPLELLEGDKLFQAFVSTKKDVSMNVGLGLGLCKQSAALMQAKFFSPVLDEDSKGTSFIVEFYIPEY